MDPNPEEVETFAQKVARTIQHEPIPPSPEEYLMAFDTTEDPQQLCNRYFTELNVLQKKYWNLIAEEVHREGPASNVILVATVQRLVAHNELPETLLEHIPQ